MENETIQPFYQIRSKEFVDMLFDKGYFREDVNRDDMQSIEDLLAWVLQLQCESAVKMALLVKKTKTET